LHPKDIDVVRSLFCDNKKLTIGAEGDRSRTGIACAQKSSGMRDWRELSIASQAEPHNVALIGGVIAGIDDIHKVKVLSYGDWFNAARLYVCKLQRGTMHSKRGYFSAAGVHCQQKRMILAQGKRAL